MFDDVLGLRPEEAARWTALVEQCRSVLADEGMEAVQSLLAERGTSTIQAIAITRALLGREETPLRAAIDAVTASKARTAASSPPAPSTTSATPPPDSTPATLHG